MRYVILALFYAIALPGAQAYAPSCPDCHYDVKYQTPNEVSARIDDATFQLAQVQSQPLAIGVSPMQTINGGTLLSEVINWLAVAFGTVLAGLGTLLVIRVRAYFGILTTDAQKAALQEIAVNAVNSAAAKAEQSVKDNPNLQINVKSAVAQDAVSYVQAHGADIIKSLGLDPNSGDAVDAIRARVATAMNSPETPTIIDNKVVNPGVEVPKS